LMIHLPNPLIILIYFDPVRVWKFVGLHFEWSHLFETSHGCFGASSQAATSDCITLWAWSVQSRTLQSRIIRSAVAWQIGYGCLEVYPISNISHPPEIRACRHRHNLLEYAWIILNILNQVSKNEFGDLRNTEDSRNLQQTELWAFEVTIRSTQACDCLLLQLLPQFEILTEISMRYLRCFIFTLQSAVRHVAALENVPTLFIFSSFFIMFHHFSSFLISLKIFMKKLCTCAISVSVVSLAEAFAKAVHDAEGSGWRVDGGWHASAARPSFHPIIPWSHDRWMMGIQMADIVRWFPIFNSVILSISSWEFNIVILTENSNGFGN
jgi:hypothetical protein